MSENSYHCVKHAESPSSVDAGKSPSAFPWKPSLSLLTLSPLPPSLSISTSTSLSISLSFPFYFSLPPILFSPLSGAAEVTVCLRSNDEFSDNCARPPLRREFPEFRKFLIITHNWTNKWLASAHSSWYRKNQPPQAHSRDYLFRVSSSGGPPSSKSATVPFSSLLALSPVRSS